MKRLPVVILPVVERQIRDQMLYIAHDSIDNALAWEGRLRAAITSIGDMPGLAVDEEASIRVGQIIRKLVFERNYLIHCRVIEETATAEIVNFRHGARLPTKGEF